MEGYDDIDEAADDAPMTLALAHDALKQTIDFAGESMGSPRGEEALEWLLDRARRVAELWEREVFGALARGILAPTGTDLDEESRRIAGSAVEELVAAREAAHERALAEAVDERRRLVAYAEHEAACAKSAAEIMRRERDAALRQLEVAAVDLAQSPDGTRIRKLEESLRTATAQRDRWRRDYGEIQELRAKIAKLGGDAAAAEQEKR